MSLKLLAQYRDDTALRTCNLPAKNDAIFQESEFGQRDVYALVQETVVMFGNHFDQYLHAWTVVLRRRKCKDKIGQIGQPEGVYPP